MMEANRKKILYLTQGAMIAAIYVVLTVFVNNIGGLASGVIQIRISEALCVLPIFTPAAIPGLFVGCLISNAVTGCVIWDVIFGSLTTLLAAFLTYKLREKKIIYLIPPIVLNALVVPFVLRFAYGMPDAIWFMMATVGAGELISVGLFGYALRCILWKKRGFIFGGERR